MGKTDDILGFLEEFGRTARVLFAVAVTAFIVLITEYVVTLNTEQVINRERAATVEQLAAIRARIEGELNSTLYLGRGMISYVATHPGLTWNDFEPIAGEMVAVGNHIRNIALAPDNVIRFIFPLSGNERALGLDYAQNKEQWPAVERAIRMGGTVVAGPVNLIQGGQGLIARTPIYIKAEPHELLDKPKYWGLASIVIDIPELFQHAGLEERMGDLDIAIRGKDGLGGAGDIFFGNPALFDDPGSIKHLVSLPNGAWQMAARPLAGWGASEKPQFTVRAIGWAVALMFGVLVYLLLSLERRNRDLALHDPLTKLPNRRLMYDRLYQLAALSDRSQFGFALVYLDLNGFKPINDEYGHHMGDKVLIEIGERLMALTRKSDTVARMGGDEFVVVLPGVTDMSTMVGVLDKLNAGIMRPMKLADHELTVSASIGFARFPEDADDVERLVNLADKNMYQDKSERVANLRIINGDD